MNFELNSLDLKDQGKRAIFEIGSLLKVCLIFFDIHFDHFAGNVAKLTRDTAAQKKKVSIVFPTRNQQIPH